jgi:hypothetical protein
MRGIARLTEELWTFQEGFAAWSYYYYYYYYYYVVVVVIIIIVVVVVKRCTNRGHHVARAANFLLRLLIFVGPRYGTFVMSLLRRPDFLRGF